ncbi:MAG: OmpH family outer membrane protein [Gammaproteobacteria bacterium]
MKSLVLNLVALFAAVSLLVGCGHEGSVAVIDLNAVASATGQDQVIREKAVAARGELQSQLQQVAVNLDQQLAAEAEKIGNSPTAEQEQQLQQMNINARSQLAEIQQRAQVQMGQIDQTLVEEFKDEVRPLAEKIAQSKGAKIIIAQDVSVFWYEPAIDITDEVIAAWRAQDGSTVSEEVTEVEEELEQVEEELAEVEEQLEELQEAVEESEVAE